MITGIEQSSQELLRLQHALNVYAGVTKRSSADFVSRKIYDLRVQLYRGFHAQRWKGTRKGSRQSKGIAFREMRARAKQGQGITFKQGLTLNGKAPEFFTRRKGGKQIKLSEHQKLVWSELARRQSGLGVLGVSFLLKRWRRKKEIDEDGKTIIRRELRENRTARVYSEMFGGVEVHEQRDYGNRKLLSRAEVGTNSATLTGYLPAHDKVSQRYGILAAALRSVREDTEVYLNRKLGPQTLREVFK
jgi:hypothetical protein